MRNISTSIVTVLAFAAFSSSGGPLDPLPDASKLPAASAQTGLTFDKDVHPIFDTACVRCHGAQRPRAGLRLDTLEGVLKGSKDNKDVIPGQSDKSRLVFAVASINGKIYMPPRPRPRPAAPNGATNAPPPPPPANAHPWKPLTTEQVGVVRAWIDQGAK